MLTTSPAPWLTKAACHGMDQSIFFPDDELPSSEIQKANRAAKRICAECPVREACLAEAMARGETDGIWGGRSPRERQRMAPASLQRWSEEEREAQAKAMAGLYAAGDSITAIAAAFGVNTKTVDDRLKKAGAVRNRIPKPRVEIDEADVAARYAAGESLTQIARVYGVEYKAIVARLERQGIARRPRKGAPGWNPTLG